MIAQEILADLESQGARFWEENGALRYSAPKGLNIVFQSVISSVSPTSILW